MVDGFEEFISKSAHVVLSIARLGTAYLNKAGREALGNPDRVVLLWSSNTREIGIRAAPKDAKNSFNCGDDGTLGFGEFMTRFDLPRPRATTKVIGRVEGDMLIFPAPKEGAE